MYKRQDYSCAVDAAYVDNLELIRLTGHAADPAEDDLKPVSYTHLELMAGLMKDGTLDKLAKKYQIVLIKDADNK